LDIEPINKEKFKEKVENPGKATESPPRGKNTTHKDLKLDNIQRKLDWAKQLIINKRQR